MIDEELVSALREWRQEAFDNLQFESAAFAADKCLSLTGEIERGCA